MLARYPLGFILTLDEPKCVPDGYVGSSLFPRLRFDPAAGFSEAAAGGVAVAVVGTCVRTDADAAPENSSRWLADALATSETLLFSRLADLCGRYVVIYRAGGRIHAVGDAACVRSIAYAGDEGVVASHARLVQDNRAATHRTFTYPTARGYPGDATPWAGTHLLTPNLVLDVQTGALRRFYPLEALRPMAVREAADHVLHRASTALRNFLKYGRTIVLGLTAGLDSRCALAVARYANVRLGTLTFLEDASSAVDSDVARLIARRTSTPHDVIDVNDVDASALDSQFRHSAYHMAFRRFTAEMIGRGRPWQVFLSSNLLEIGRTFYAGHGAIETLEDVTGVYMRTLVRHQAKLSDEKLALYEDRARVAFGDYLEKTCFWPATKFVEAGDLLYWEHRMPAWHSQAIMNRDQAMDTFIPFNSRSIFDAMLSVEQAKRRKGAIQLRLIKRLLPELSDVPINPKTFAPLLVTPG
ncbi:hypothetical protein [Methylopila sp. M107]|uniref:hypothetical protein n=1 Tax=Methylopila sp. M107 TaxID=1101190 RepID=UPI0003637968|nr:hypothetical protein [Methylopila sp. M107]